MTAFRAYDVRGIYGVELTEEMTKRIGTSFGSYARGGRVAIGRDTRVSGPPLEKALLEGIMQTGCETQFYGIIPISILSFITKQDKLKAAAYISASHNPPEYNGIRFRTSDGYGLLYRESDIMKYYNEGGFIVGQGKLEKRQPKDAIYRYAQYVSDKLHYLRGLKIVLDMGNGSACTMGSFYKELGFDPFIINGTADGQFPGRGPAPDEKTLRTAAEFVIQKRADYGIGFDPDADRGIVIDDRGRVVPPEKVAIMIARRRYKTGDKVISGFDCSMILEKELEKDGIIVKREKVGDVFVANRVKDSGAVLGVERSGHFFLPEFQYSDDPFAMSLALGEIISEGHKLSELSDEIPDYPYLQKSIRIKGDPLEVMKHLRDALSALEPDMTDGLKIINERYSVLIRPSNTEPILRLYLETFGANMSDLEKKYDQIIHNAIIS